MVYLISAICLILAALLLVPIIQSLDFYAEVPMHNWVALDWMPELGQFGFGLPLIGTLALVSLALPWTLALGWALAYQVENMTSGYARAVVLGLLQTWSSMPSVVIGVWAISTIIPSVRMFEGSGYSLLAASVGLTLFLAPSTALLLLQAYKGYREEHADLELSLKLNAWERSSYFWKSSKNQILHVVNYSLCRIFGETMIVLMLSGNMLQVPGSVFDGMRTLTATVALEMAYAVDLHSSALYGITAFAILCISTILLLRKEVRNAVA